MRKPGRVWGIFPCSVEIDFGRVDLDDESLGVCMEKSWLNGWIFDAFNAVIFTVFGLFGIEEPVFSISIDE